MQVKILFYILISIKEVLKLVEIYKKIINYVIRIKISKIIFMY
jgi:hypothetical protein